MVKDTNYDSRSSSSPNRMKAKKIVPRHIIIKLLRIKGKAKSRESSQTKMKRSVQGSDLSDGGFLIGSQRLENSFVWEMSLLLRPSPLSGPRPGLLAGAGP